MATADVSDIFLGIGQNLGNAVSNYRQQSRLQELGGTIGSGDYKGAAKKFFELGEYKTGLDLLKLGQEEEAAASVAPVLGGGGQEQQPRTPSLTPIGNGPSTSSGLSGSIIQQESGGNPNVQTSVNGAQGIGQIMPGTFSQYAKPGESISNPDNNLAVHKRIVDDYSQKYGGDPARVAVAYFSGPGNVAPPGSPTPWKRDVADGNGKRVSGYVSDVTGRLGGGHFDKLRTGSTQLAGPVPQPDTAPEKRPAPAGAQQAAQSLLAQLDQLERAAVTPHLGAGLQKNIQSRIDGIKYKIDRLDKQFDFERKQEAESSKILGESAARQKLIESQGGNPSDPRIQQFINTGRYAREDQSPLTATDKKAILEADETVQAGANAVAALKQAKVVSKNAFGFPGAATLSKFGAVAGNQASQETVDLDNLTTGQALESLRAIFGGMPTEGERKILLQLQGSSGLPDAARQKIYDRAITLAERRTEFNKQRAAELRGGEFYKPGGGGADKPVDLGPAQGTAPQGQAPAPGGRVRVFNPATGKLE